MNRKDQLSFGVFKPVGYVVISFPSAEQALQARDALARMGLQGEAVSYLTDEQMLREIAHDKVSASAMASIGQEMNLVRAHQALAERGYHWLIVHALSDTLAREVADTVKPFGAERAQHYGHFIIEELIEAATGLPQTRESADTGLDAQTPSGLESQRADLAPRPR
jgi:hypothetical protein